MSDDVPRWPAERNGIALPLPPPLQCSGPSCRTRRQAAVAAWTPAEDVAPLYRTVGSRFFRCDRSCSVVAFLYPRKPRRVNDSGPVAFHFHQGVDIGGPADEGPDSNSVLIAVVNGTIVGPTAQNGYGQTIHIKADGQNLWYKYAHCHTILPEAAVGRRVVEQQPIGFIGRTDCNTRGIPEGKTRQPHYLPGVYDGAFGPHLHFEVLTVDPAQRMNEVTLDQTAFGTDFTAPGLARVDPRQHLRELGPWGGPKLHFPLMRGASDEEGYEVTEARAELLFAETESSGSGGYFPLGANQTWHGGVHLRGEPGALVRAPFQGRVVAARLDPDPDFAMGAFGSTNFILMVHDLPAARIADFQGQREDDDAHRGSVGVDQRGRRRPRRAENEPADVDEVRTLLQQAGYYHPEADADVPADSSPDPEGEPDSPDAFEPALLDAIIRFQRTLVRRPDGLVDIPGRTYRALEGAAAQSAREARAAAGEHPDRVYSLFMHLSPETLDDRLATRIPWLGRVAAVPTDAEREADERARRVRADIIETEVQAMPPGDREYRITASVRENPSRRQRRPSAEDISWVQRRLTAHGFPVAVDGVGSPALFDAIRAFQTEHASGTADGVVSAPRRRQASGTTTFFLLALTPTELQHPEGTAAEPLMDARFAERAATRSDNVAEVLAGDDFGPSGSMDVASGEALWVVGEVHGVAPDAASDRGISRRLGDQAVPATGIHWEIFTEDAIISRFEQIEDTNDDRSIDSVDLINRIRAAMRDAPPTVGPFAPEEGEVEDPTEGAVEIEGTDVMSSAEVARFYNSEGSRFLRRVQVRFHSEWALDPAQVTDSFAALGWNRELLPQMLAPYMWWGAAGDAVPSSPLVWHVNPIAFLLLYRQQLPPDPAETATESPPAVSAPILGSDAEEDDSLDDESHEWHGLEAAEWRGVPYV